MRPPKIYLVLILHRKKSKLMKREKKNNKKYMHVLNKTIPLIRNLF